MVAARLLDTRHKVEMFEAGSHVGGHAQTVDVEVPNSGGKHVSVDVAFMVLNRRTYPNFCSLLDHLGIETQPSDMSLSVRCFSSGLEYQGSSFNGIFAKRANLLRPSFLRMLRDIVRFNQVATEFCQEPDETLTLGCFLDRQSLGDEFCRHYLIPMSAAIWSADPECLRDFPAKFILGFLKNHGLLQIRDRPQWLTIANRSKAYVKALTSPFSDRIHTNCRVTNVRSTGDKLLVTHSNPSGNNSRKETTREFDHVVFATHADQTLKMLSDATETEADILRGFPYQPNEAVLHTDTSILPTRRRAWASWNYHLPEVTTDRVSVTYDLNRLQSLGLEHPLCLTLNPNHPISEDKVIQRFEFEHPVFSAGSAASQSRFHEINNQRGISYCGAYWRYGFHEDGVNSALAVTEPFGIALDALGATSNAKRLANGVAEEPVTSGPAMVMIQA